MGKFDGNTIFHHVTNNINETLYNLSFLGINISITKHVLMLWIVAVSCVALAVYATRKYRISKQALQPQTQEIFAISIARAHLLPIVASR